MSAVGDRSHQTFPVLDPAQMRTAQRFASGPEVRFAPGESLYAIGEAGGPAWFVVDGSIEVVRRDGLSHEAVITTLGPGQFSGEVNQLSGRPALAGGRAGPAGCSAVTLDASHLRALMIGAAPPRL
jgi:thioredoxin reductase (NADPH)